MNSTAATMPMGWFAGLLVFSLASLLGGLAAGQAWLIAAPTALSLVAVTFPAGRPRNRAVAA